LLVAIINYASFARLKKIELIVFSFLSTSAICVVPSISSLQILMLERPAASFSRMLHSAHSSVRRAAIEAETFAVDLALIIMKPQNFRLIYVSEQKATNNFHLASGIMGKKS
jgi:hypothetical protein